MISFLNLVKNELVQEVSYQKSLVHMINENVRRISLILLIAGAALMLISFTSVSYTHLFFCSIDNGSNDFSRDQVFIPADRGR